MVGEGREWGVLLIGFIAQLMISLIVRFATIIADQINAMLDNASSIRRELIEVVPKAQSLAFDAGRELKRLIEDV